MNKKELEEMDEYCKKLWLEISSKDKQLGYRKSETELKGAIFTLKDGSKMTVEINDKQYFTPIKEDFRFGYEFEFDLDKDMWKNKTVDNYLDLEGIDYYLNECRLRVSYLTKDQIEAEGWTIDERSDELFSRKDNHHFYKGNLSLSLFIGYLKDEIIWYSISIYNSEGTLFKGSCKDINTFRYVCKLIEND